MSVEKINVENEILLLPHTDEPHLEETWWSACRTKSKADEKTLMAQHFASHDFLLPEGQNPEGARETVASIIVNQGTSPDRVVREALEWILHKENQDRGPFFLTWYTPGHLVPTTLKSFRDAHRHLRTATRLFLFPGEVDEETESVSGPDAEYFAEQLQRRFTYAFLSAYSFDVCTGSVYFHLPRELRLQKACAKCFAAHKFLFLDSSKFKSEGERGYGIGDLLDTAYKVTIYTVSSLSPKKDSWIKARFEQLCATLLKNQPAGMEDHTEVKKLRLTIVGRDGSQTQSFEKEGVLIAPRQGNA